MICLICLAGYAAVGLLYPEVFSWGYFLGSSAIALIGWLDDLYSLPIAWKFPGYLVIAGVAFSSIGFFHDATLFFNSDISIPASAGVVLTFLWIVWVVNAYNFMDGIDGIAGLHAVVAAVSWAVAAASLDMPMIFFYSGIVAASCLGFLVLNWQPAKIFMGDIGSSFLGFTFACLPLLGARENSTNAPLMPLAAGLLAWFVLFDTGVTLIRRILRGGRFWEPHREHLYQRMVDKGLSHSTVAGLYGAGSAILAVELIFFVHFRIAGSWILLFSLTSLTALLVFAVFRKKQLT